MQDNIGTGLFIFGMLAIALFLWIYAVRLLRRIYRKFREDYRRAAEGIPHYCP